MLITFIGNHLNTIVSCSFFLFFIFLFWLAGRWQEDPGRSDV